MFTRVVIFFYQRSSYIRDTSARYLRENKKVMFTAFSKNYHDLSGSNSRRKLKLVSRLCSELTTS
uniref:Uncharacterized protein n=1 Tax=Octopus bimaculoides TaxID=37653 RepID=A0A0L8GZW6_OCTBM